MIDFDPDRLLTPLLSLEGCVKADLNVQEEYRKRHPLPPRPASPPTGPFTIKYDDFEFARQRDIAVFFHTNGTVYDRSTGKRPRVLHDHDFYELNYVYHGQVRNVLSEECIHQDNSHILLMSPYAFHNAYTCSKDTVLFNIMIRKEFSSHSLYRLDDLLLDSGLTMTPLCPYMVFKNTPEITLIIHQMIQDFYKNDLLAPSMLSVNLMKLFFLFGKERKATEGSTGSTAYPPEIHRIYLYIREHYDTVTLHGLAEAFSFSDNYLSRLIKKHTGASFNEIVYQIKMQKAAAYLLYSDYSITRICELVGYSDPGHFRKQFKKKYQVSPADYRRRQQEPV